MDQDKPKIEVVSKIEKHQFQSDLTYRIASKVRVPSEFEPQKALWLSWRWEGAKRHHPYFKVLLEVISKIPQKYSINVICDSEDDIPLIKRQIRNRKISLDNIHFFPMGNTTIWLRDTGPCFVKSRDQQVKLIKFGFNEWGYGDDTLTKDHLIPDNIAKITRIPMTFSSSISEGGNREVNGEGVLITVEEVELQRNPGKTKKMLEAEFEKHLGVKKTIWLPKGLCEDQITEQGLLPDHNNRKTYFTTFNPGGHVDEFCRFVDANTILLAKVPLEAVSHPIHLENSKRLEKCYEILKQARNLKGEPFRIIRVPIAPLLTDYFDHHDSFYTFYKDHEFTPSVEFPKGKFRSLERYSIVVPTSYLNFLVFNEVVLIPTYLKEGQPESVQRIEAQVVALFKKLYPTKSIVQVDPYAINLAGGGLHCITFNQPI